VVQGRDTLLTELRGASEDARKDHQRPHALLFIHGYNVDFEGAAIRAAQIGCDLKVPGVTAFFSWPSRGSLVSYPADEATIEASEGAITDFTSATQFSVNGILVDATNATFPDGTMGLRKGARVEVKGAVKDGVLIATKVELEDMHRGDDRHRNELHGVVQDLNTDLHTFTVHGVTVHYSVDGTTVFQRGTVSDLANKKPVEVKGTLVPGSSTVEALIIRFES